MGKQTRCVPDVIAAFKQSLYESAIVPCCHAPDMHRLSCNVLRQFCTGKKQRSIEPYRTGVKLDIHRVPGGGN